MEIEFKSVSITSGDELNFVLLFLLRVYRCIWIILYVLLCLAGKTLACTLYTIHYYTQYNMYMFKHRHVSSIIEWLVFCVFWWNSTNIRTVKLCFHSKYMFLHRNDPFALKKIRKVPLFGFGRPLINDKLSS